MKILTAQQVREIMEANNVCADQVFMPDKRYAVPEVEWLRKDFAVALRKLFVELGAETWTAEQNDCDDFARGAAWFASVLHNRYRESGLGLLFGEYWYVQKSGGAHAINCTIDADEQRVIFFEPQRVIPYRDPIMELQMEEKLGCIGYRF